MTTPTPAHPWDSLLATYGPERLMWTDLDGQTGELSGAGGGLSSAFERVGQAPLIDALGQAYASVVLCDGELTVCVERTGSAVAVRASWGDTVVAREEVSRGPSRLVGPGALGAPAFREAHGVRWAYVAGAMAGGISSVALVVAMQRAGLLGFFGAGGLPLEQVEAALVSVKEQVTGDNWGFNLLHSPMDPAVEERTVDLYLTHGVRRVSASAFLRVTRAVVRYRLTGIHRGEDGRVVCPNHVFAKVSRTETATPFLLPAPAEIVAGLVADGTLTPDQGALAGQVPLAEDITAEGDSGGHTDHRPLLVLVPQLLALRDRVAAEQGYAVPPRVGAAGGLGTPDAVWAAFAAGADYVLTGSINQATVEAGTSDVVKTLLSQAGPTDIASGPAPDMFELGAKVQVLARGTMYAQRAQRLYDLYRAYPSLDAIPDEQRRKIEKQILRRDIADIWSDTADYWRQRDPEQLARAEREPRHKMALVFRWYLGQTSRWARSGDDVRKRDYQIWCGPAMGGFNAWADGGPLQDLANRDVVGLAEAVMVGAAACAGATAARLFG